MGHRGLAVLATISVVLVWLAGTHETYSGTNSVVVRSVAAQVPPLWLERRFAIARGWEIAVLATALVGVIAGVGAAYFSTQPVENLPEQGRYAFTAIMPLAAVAVAARFAYGRRAAPLVAATLASGLVGFSFCAQLLRFMSFYW